MKRERERPGDWGGREGMGEGRRGGEMGKGTQQIMSDLKRHRASRAKFGKSGKLEEGGGGGAVSAGHLEFAVFHCTSKSIFQVNLTILINYIWIRPIKITGPRQIRIIEHVKYGIFQHAKIWSIRKCPSLAPCVYRVISPMCLSNFIMVLPLHGSPAFLFAKSKAFRV